MLQYLKGVIGMEKKFEVKYLPTIERRKDMYRYIFFGTGAAKFLMILCAYVILDCILLAVFYKSYTSAIGGILFILFFAAIYLLRYKQSIKLSHTRDLEFNNGVERESNFSVCDNGISKHTGEETATIPFESIKSAKRKKKYLFVRTRSKVIFAFPADSFVLGDIDGMADFLKSKGIKVR